MSSQIAQVYEFNELMGFAFIPPSHLPNGPIVSFMLSSLNEEMTELEEAIVDNDLVKIVDSILDLTYFAFGHLRKLGITQEQAEACFDAVHAANMTKRRMRMASRGNFEDDAGKPKNFVAPDEAIAKILGVDLTEKS